MVAIHPVSKIWLDGHLVPWDQARVHVLTHALHYGYAVFEGIRCHGTPRGPAVFRLDDHLQRFLDSAKIYGMKLPFTLPQLRAATVELVRANGLADAYIRPIAFSGYGEMGLDPRSCPIQVAMALWQWGAYPGRRRRDPRGPGRGLELGPRRAPFPPPQAKCAANYANSALAKMEAVAAGCDEAIMLNSAGMVAEGPGENIFRVKQGIVSTPPASSGILRGITRDTVIRLVAEEGWTFHRTDFSREELYTADELFFVGTAAGVTPMREVDGRSIGSGDYPITRRLQERYDAALHGRLPGHEDWLTYVE